MTRLPAQTTSNPRMGSIARSEPEDPQRTTSRSGKYESFSWQNAFNYGPRPIVSPTSSGRSFFAAPSAASPAFFCPPLQARCWKCFSRKRDADPPFVARLSGGLLSDGPPAAPVAVRTSVPSLPRGNVFLSDRAATDCSRVSASFQSTRVSRGRSVNEVHMEHHGGRPSLVARIRNSRRTPIADLAVMSSSLSGFASTVIEGNGLFSPPSGHRFSSATLTGRNWPTGTLPAVPLLRGRRAGSKPSPGVSDPDPIPASSGEFIGEFGAPPGGDAKPVRRHRARRPVARVPG